MDRLDEGKYRCRILLVDDDASFGKIIQKLAKQDAISVIVCHPLSNPEILSKYRWDAAIVDYDLGNTTGVQLSKLLETITGRVPTVLVSQTVRTETIKERWPKSVVGFVHKMAGHQTILDMAVDAWKRLGKKAVFKKGAV